MASIELDRQISEADSYGRLPVNATCPPPAVAITNSDYVIRDGYVSRLPDIGVNMDPINSATLHLMFCNQNNAKIPDPGTKNHLDSKRASASVD